jgi:hypothetical protein
MYRVAPVQGGLYIEVRRPEGEIATRDVIFDGAARYDIGVHPEAKLRELIEKELAKLPYFNFLGIGFINPSERRGICFGLSLHGTREDIFDSDNKLALKIRNMIDVNFGSIKIFPEGASNS